MSIESLLIAAQYLDYKAEVEARGEEPQDYTTYFFYLRDSYGKDDEVSDDGNHGKGSRKHDRSVNRETHNRLEKFRRAQMREGFDHLKNLVPTISSPKISNLALLKETTKYIKVLRAENESKKSELRKLEIKHVKLVTRKKSVCDMLDSHLVESVLNKNYRCDNASSPSSTSECEETVAVSKKRKFSFTALTDAVEEVRNKCAEEPEAPLNEVVLPAVASTGSGDSCKSVIVGCKTDLSNSDFDVKKQEENPVKSTEVKDDFDISYAEDLLSFASCCSVESESKTESVVAVDIKPSDPGETELLKELKKSEPILKRKTLLRLPSFENKDHFLRKSMHNYSALPGPDIVLPSESGKKLVQSCTKVTRPNSDEGGNNILLIRPSTVLANGLLTPVSESDSHLPKVVLNSCGSSSIGKPVKFMTTALNGVTCKPFEAKMDKEGRKGAALTVDKADQKTTANEKDVSLLLKNLHSGQNGLVAEAKRSLGHAKDRDKPPGPIIKCNADINRYTAIKLEQKKPVGANFIDGKLSVLAGAAATGSKPHQNIILQVPSSIMPSLKPVKCLPDKALGNGEIGMCESRKDSLQNTPKSFHAFEARRELNQSANVGSKLFVLSFPNTG